MAARRTPWRVSDRLWAEVEPLLPKVERRFRYPGRRRHDDRACLEGILYVLRYAVPWAELPRVEGWPSGQTCWRRFHEWQGAGGLPTGRVRSSMPPWSMRKGGRQGRPLAPRPPWKPLPPSGRRQRRPVCATDRRRKRERTRAPVAADRDAADAGPGTRRALGRPRLRLGHARAGAA